MKAKIRNYNGRYADPYAAETITLEGHEAEQLEKEARKVEDQKEEVKDARTNCTEA